LKRGENPVYSAFNWRVDVPFGVHTGEYYLVFLDLETGKETARVKMGRRLCCGIFDFCEAPDNTVAVSNLGAFKIQRYNLDGKLISEFGKRGRGFDDFHGCCNPVSASYLPGGNIVTVEKDPTRILLEYQP
jgi:hypothetical protein